MPTEVRVVPNAPGAVNHTISPGADESARTANTDTYRHLPHIRELPAPDGTFPLVEPFANDRVEDNLNLVGRLYYTASTVVRVPHSISEESRAAR